MVHRGPDDVGVWDGDSHVSLGMRRLSIVDVASGSQPIANEDGTVWVVFNGEIYNHPELRAELEAHGHRFRSDHSDTEVLVHLYEEYGPEYLNKLNGMFAIALWDGRRRELHLARDRAGIKPLYWAAVGESHIFASEIKALLVHPSIHKQPNWRSSISYGGGGSISKTAATFRRLMPQRIFANFCRTVCGFECVPMYQLGPTCPGESIARRWLR
jgi:asparagine synthase (glutamine-hydrolysing)